VRMRMWEYPGFGRGKVESREESYRRWKNGKSGLSLPAATVIRELQGGTEPRVFRGDDHKIAKKERLMEFRARPTKRQKTTDDVEVARKTSNEHASRCFYCNKGCQKRCIGLHAEKRRGEHAWTCVGRLHKHELNVRSVMPDRKERTVQTLSHRPPNGCLSGLCN
jgi:hypothetical protein